ncbi:uncharacterized protein LOC111024417 [Momordica charantia]|uniref:Uncharacterized protein LOC111024417 n=1 Tax=Momordica charantia TaxID=3673 RepID=A0A6J1DVG2_MOMCH|nr:uncharacterized protein LOC111024417 [Momordica charantia]
MCYFFTGLADETLTVKLGEEAPSTFDEVLQKAKKVIDGQELLRTKQVRTNKRSNQKKPGGQEKGKSDSKSKDKGSSPQGRSDYRRSDSDSSRRGPYESLEKLLKRPDKLRGDLEKRNKDRYCRFHRDHGHNTSSCWDLELQIEDLIQDGYFKKYVGKTGASSSGNKRKELAREARWEVCTIQEQKPTCRISFSDSDLEGVHLSHNDALVISPFIDHVQVRRELVDGGASANILSLTTYLALGWTRAQLKKSLTPLVGFAGESVTLEGCIDLSITIAQCDTKVTQMVEFVVIDGSTVYALEEQSNLLSSATQTYENELPKTNQGDVASLTEELELVPLLNPKKQVSIGTKLGAADRE